MCLQVLLDEGEFPFHKKAKNFSALFYILFLPCVNDQLIKQTNKKWNNKTKEISYIWMKAISSKKSLQIKYLLRFSSLLAYVAFGSNIIRREWMVL